MARGNPPRRTRASRLRPLSGILAGVLWLLAALPATAQAPRPESRTLSEWTNDLGGTDVSARRRAIAALVGFGAEAVPHLTPVVTGDPDPEARLDAIRALIKLGPTARPAVPAICAATKDRIVFVRRGAAIALGIITPAGPEAVEALMGALIDPDAVVVDNAAHGLMGIGNLAVPPLTKALSSPDNGLRQMAVLTLSGGIRFGRFRDVGTDTVSALIATLADPDVDTRDEAARALADLGPSARAALPALERMAADDPEGSARVTARRAIERIGQR